MATTTQDFPLLKRVAIECSLRPQDIDGLVSEFGGIFESVAKSLIQSYLPQIQKDKWEHFMRIVRFVVFDLSAMCHLDDNLFAKMRLLLKSTATPINLEALLRIMNTDVRTGSIRCNAIIIMDQLVGSADLCIWSMKLGIDGQENFSTEYLKVLGKILHQEATRGDSILHCYSDNVHDKRCKCLCMERGVWKNILVALQMTKDDPFTIINILDNFDWIAILESDEAPIDIDYPSKAKLFNDMCIAYILTMHVRHVLSIDKDNSKARSLYRKVGQCLKLFHRVLKRIITAGIYSHPPKISDPSTIFMDLAALTNYIDNCVLLALDSSCINDETNRLVDCAQSTLQRVLNMPKIKDWKDPSQPFKIENIVYILSQLTSSSLTTMTSSLTEEMRVERMINECKDGTKVKRQKNGMRKCMKKVVRDAEKAGNIYFDMCANCFVTDADLKKEGKVLLKCTSCNQVTYCSRNCQKKQWKKHKKLCTK